MRRIGSMQSYNNITTSSHQILYLKRRTSVIVLQVGEHPDVVVPLPGELFSEANDDLVVILLAHVTGSRGLNEAISLTERSAASQSGVTGVARRVIFFLRRSMPENESASTVARVSPANSTRSSGRNRQTCPGVCPGVYIHRQFGTPGTSPPAGNSRARSLPR